ncbi:hypothetical protein V9L05_11605 [Bernardetia sp. Wsw4-3y2]|uniref:hypothetical protein n=1 Tax=Bernardetia sp. Wsw4-3y2 TaxID=3127471 RepID=UPI0030CDC68C
MKNLFCFLMFFMVTALFSCVDSKEEITQETAVLPFLKKEVVNSDKLPSKITTREELETVLNFHYKDLFSKIPTKDLAAFMETVEYNERGITTFRYDYLKKNVSKEELQTIYEILLIVEKRAEGTLKIKPEGCPFVGFKCYSTGSCLEAGASWICTCNC